MKKLKDHKVVSIRNKKTGKMWTTPKGKHTWNGVGFAKLAWNCHNWKPRKSKYGTFNDNCKWDEDAKDYEIVTIGEFKYTGTIERDETPKGKAWK